MQNNRTAKILFLNSSNINTKKSLKNGANKSKKPSGTHTLSPSSSSSFTLCKKKNPKFIVILIELLLCLDLVNPQMEQEEPCEVKETASISIEPKTPNPNVPDSIPAIDSDSSLSEEEIITQKDRGIVTLSPLCNQYNDKMRVDSVSISDCVLVSDEDIIDSIYQNLLSVIVSLQTQNVAAAVAASGAEIWCFDCCKTPPPSSRNLDSKLDSDTCPGAPMKLTKISRNIDSGLRRKLF